MKRKRTRLFGWTFLFLFVFVMPPPCVATLIMFMHGDEIGGLVSSFENAKQSIDVRCIAIEEPALIAALKRASERGVRVRIVVDAISPALRRAVETGNSNLEVRLLSPQNQKRFLSLPIMHRSWHFSSNDLKPLSAEDRRYLQRQEPTSCIEIDRRVRWNGVARLSFAHRVGVSVCVIHNQHPDPEAGSSFFLKAWQRSKPQDDK